MGRRAKLLPVLTDGRDMLTGLFLDANGSTTCIIGILYCSAIFLSICSGGVSLNGRENREKGLGSGYFMHLIIALSKGRRLCLMQWIS